MKINYSFLFLTIFLLYSGNSLEYCIFMFSLILHELGHVIVCLLFKGRIKKVSLQFYGFVCDIDVTDLKTIPKVLIYLSGMMMNLIIIIILKNNYFNISSSLKEFNNIIIINKVIIIFNILIIYPLDGYQILHTILDKIFNNEYYDYSFKISMICSLICLFVFLVYCIYNEIIGLILISIILIIKNIKKIRMRDREILEKIFKLIT